MENITGIGQRLYMLILKGIDVIKEKEYAMQMPDIGEQASLPVNMQKETLHLELKRKYFKKSYTIGKLYVNGEDFSDTLEDYDRKLNKQMTNYQISQIKIMHETAIPYGTYEVDITYSNKFQKWMPQVLDVPGFGGVRIHYGKTAENTYGCILVGVNDKRGMLSEGYSPEGESTYQRLYKMLKQAKDSGRKIELTIK